MAIHNILHQPGKLSGDMLRGQVRGGFPGTTSADVIPFLPGASSAGLTNILTPGPAVKYFNLMRTCMSSPVNLFRSYKRTISLVMLCMFIFSANALSCSAHLVEELDHVHSLQATLCASDSPFFSAMTDGAATHDDSDQGGQQNDGEPCCDGHSHASLLDQPLCFNHTPQLISRPVFEPFRFIPEVFLDKFIPPQNLA